MKILKKLLILLLILLLLLGTFIFLIGFGYYSKTLNEKSLTSRVEEVTSKEHFVPFEQLPKNYINAVIAVEDMSMDLLILLVLLGPCILILEMENLMKVEVLLHNKLQKILFLIKIKL